MFGRWKKQPANAPPADDASIYLGHYFYPSGYRTGTPLTYSGERHLLLFGPSGSGKSTRLLVTNLLRMQGRSLIVIDPKGELAAVTARYRHLNGEVLILNPFDVFGWGHTNYFNPLAALDPAAPTFVDDVAGLGEALVMNDPNEKDPHWSDSARSLIVALIMWEVKLAKEQNRQPLLENVRAMLTEAEERDADGIPITGLRHTASEILERGGFEATSLISRFLRDSDEVASIKSTADRHTSWILSPLMRANMAKNEIDFAALKERPITVYLILPAERMRTHAVWLRLVIVSALRALYRPGSVKTLFMLDEFAQLGHLGPIEDALALVRGFGIQLWPVLQDLNQLKALYKERWETFIGNAGVVQGFAPNDLTTAEWMSRRSGDTTVAAAGYNTGDSLSNAGQGSSSTGLSYGQVRRALFLPQELMDFKQGAGLLWPVGTSKSVPFYAHPYWHWKKLYDRANPNPYHEGSNPVPPVRSRITGEILPPHKVAVNRALNAIERKIGEAARSGWNAAREKTLSLVRKPQAQSVEISQASKDNQAQKEPGPPVTASRDAGGSEQR